MHRLDQFGQALSATPRAAFHAWSPPKTPDVLGKDLILLVVREGLEPWPYQLRGRITL
jgi:hypothetical protein